MSDVDEALRLWGEDTSAKRVAAWVSGLAAAGEVDRLADLARALRESPMAPHSEGRLVAFDRTACALAAADPRTMLALLRDMKLLDYQVATNAFDAAAGRATKARLEELLHEEAATASRRVLELLRDMLHAVALFGVADLHRGGGASILAARLAEAGADGAELPFAPHPLETKLAKCLAGAEPWPDWTGDRADRSTSDSAPRVPDAASLSAPASSSFDDLFLVETGVWRYEKDLPPDALPRSRRDLEPYGDLPPMRESGAAEALCLLFRGRRQGLAGIGDARRHAWAALAALSGAPSSDLENIAKAADPSIWSVCATPGEVDGELATIWIQTLRPDRRTVATIRAWYDKYR